MYSMHLQHAIITRSRSRIRAGVTLLEVLLVVVIISIIAATAVPSLSGANQAQIGAGMQGVQTMLTTARTRAASEGKPFGVRIVNQNSPYVQDTVWMVVIESAGASVTGARGADGVVSQPGDAGSLYPTNFISAVAGGSPTDETIWFDQIGRPHTRTAGGAFDSYWSADRTITFANGETLIVRRLSGAVEVQ